MRFNIIGDDDCPLVNIQLDRSEKIRIERGAMAYMANVSLEGKMNTKEKGIGGFFSALGRSLVSGESFFVTEAVGTADDGEIGIAPSIPGKIVNLEVGCQQYCLNTGAFLACDESVDYEIITQDVGKALLGGTGGLFIMKTNGQGDLLVNAFGDIVELEVTEDRPITIDNEHVVAWDSSLNYDIEVASGTFGFTTGEGFVDKFTGNGKVLIQTRNIRALSEEIRKFIPTQSSND